MAFDWIGALPRPVLIGERLNAAGNPRLAARLAAGEWAAVGEEARAQAAAGARVLDVCGALSGADERATLREMLARACAACDLPIAVDSRDPAVAIEALEALAAARRPALFNSVPATRDGLERTLPRAAALVVPVVVLAMDEAGVPPSAEGRFACAERVVRAGRALAMPDAHLIIDCLAVPAPAGRAESSSPLLANAVALDAMRLAKSRLGVSLVLGISNVSYGIAPSSARRAANAAFLREALAAGLDFAIADPLDPEIRRALASGC